jgi:lipopolysaccharide transport system ATP-binding protein
MKPILEIKNISKRFRIQHNLQPYLSLRDSVTSFFKGSKSFSEDFYALKDVSFNVEAGQSIGIIGKNGAGKSTLLKILSKITPPTTGSIISRGRIASLLEVGTGFHPELTGRENIFLNGSILGMKRKEIQSKFDEIVDFSGTEKFLDTPLKHYSSGMQLRLAFSVAAFLDPEILIIDEVLAVGDLDFQKKCLGKMEDAGKTGKTILFVSHNLAAVQNLCSKTILIHQGSIQQFDDTGKVISTYITQHRMVNKIDLSRRKNKKIHFTDFRIQEDVNSNGIHTYPEKECTFLIDIYSESETDNVQVGIGINDRNNIRLISLSTGFLATKYKLKKGINTVICKVDSLPLKPDTYYVQVYVGNGFEAYDVSYDEISMEVLPADFYYKSVPDYSQGSVIVKHEWREK